MDLKHRNSQKRIYEIGRIYYTVSKIFQNFPYFKEPLFCELLIEELRLCKKLRKFKLLAFSIMYDHLNLMAQTTEEINISQIMQFVKRNFSRHANYIMGFSYDKGAVRHGSHFEGDNYNCRLQNVSHGELRCALEEFDLKLQNFKTQFIHKYCNVDMNNLPKFKWQKSFRDHLIRNKRDY